MRGAEGGGRREEESTMQNPDSQQALEDSLIPLIQIRESVELASFYCIYIIFCAYEDVCVRVCVCACVHIKSNT